MAVVPTELSSSEQEQIQLQGMVSGLLGSERDSGLERKWEDHVLPRHAQPLGISVRMGREIV